MPIEKDGNVDGVCNRCGVRHACWSASSPLWNAVMRGGSIDGPWEYGELICANCFMTLATERGVADLFYVTAQQINVTLETVTPSGRIWNEERKLWDEPGASMESGGHAVEQLPRRDEGCGASSDRDGENSEKGGKRAARQTETACPREGEKDMTTDKAPSVAMCKVGARILWSADQNSIHVPFEKLDDMTVTDLAETAEATYLAMRALEPATPSDEVREALAGLVSAVEQDANGEFGISGYTGARLSDAQAALATPQPSRDGEVEREEAFLSGYCAARDAEHVTELSTLEYHHAHRCAQDYHAALAAIPSPVVDQPKMEKLMRAAAMSGTTHQYDISSPVVEGEVERGQPLGTWLAGKMKDAALAALRTDEPAREGE